LLNGFVSFEDMYSVLLIEDSCRLTALFKGCYFKIILETDDNSNTV